MEETITTKDSVVYAAASAIGIVAGMRAMTAPAVMGYLASSGCLESERHRFGLFGRPGVLKVLVGLASGEALFDKLPFAPKRTDSPGLIARIVSGALCGATICSVKEKSMTLGAIAGALGAIGSTFAVYNIRRSLAEQLNVPDPAIALAEDAAAIYAGKLICGSLKSA